MSKPKEIPTLATTMNGLHALDHLRGENGSFQDALHHDAIAAHAMRHTLDCVCQERDALLDERDRYRGALELVYGSEFFGLLEPFVHSEVENALNSTE